jgi:peptide/nickel transport system substrate-binding protein
MNLRRLRYLSALTALLTGAVAVSACSSAGSSGSSNAIFTTISEFQPITAGAPLNPFNATNNTFTGFDNMQLAWTANNPENSNELLPGLASSWSLSPDGTTLTVHLQPHARWSNGKPVTATDVKLSAAIWFTQSEAQPYNLGTVKVVNSSTVEFVQTPGSHNNQFESGILQNYVVSASVYGSQVPSDIWTTIAASNGTGKGASAATTQLTTLGKKITTFSPSTDVSAGPFYVKAVNSGEALLEKNPYFYAADKVQPSQVLMLHYSGNQQIWSYMQSGRLDAAPYTAMPTNVLKQVESEGNKEVTSPSLVAVSLAFDQKVYPYGDLAVRQALAYLINRSAVQKVGEPVSGIPSTTTTGVISSALGDYLSSSQRASLNSYTTSTSTATSLLTKAGFTKKGGQWYMPDGKPWTITLNDVSGFSDWVAGASVIKSELSSFGIPTSIKLAPDYATYLANLYKGDYPVGFWLIALGPGAYTTYSPIYGTYDGYVPSGTTLKRYPTGNAAADNFINTPNTVTVPGLGTVNPGQLTYDLTNVNLSNPAGVSQQNALMAKLIQATNYEVPVIQLWDYVNVQFVDNKRFDDWPIGNNGLLDAQPGVWMADGFVHVK